MQPDNLVAVLEGALRTREARHLGRPPPQDLAHRRPGHLQGSGDDAHALPALPALMQFKNRVPDPDVLSDARRPPRPRSCIVLKER